MRNAFIEELVALAATRDNIALIVGDLGYSVVEPFADRFPDRFINAGVAEQSMTSLAAGMASEGYHVFTYSIANFPTFRCAEQIRNDVAYHNLPVTVVSVGGGLAYGALGYSHHAVQDYALMRCMPNMLIAAPGDVMETRACVRYLVEHPQPSYLRLGKAGGGAVHSSVPDITPGVWLKVSTNWPESRHCVLTTGGTLEFAMRMVESDGKLKSAEVFSLPLWGMAQKRLQIEQLKAFSHVVTVEDHLVDGGLGSWLLEAASTTGGPIIAIKALESAVCGAVASQKVLNELGGLVVL
jgi:transketolase